MKGPWLVLLPSLLAGMVSCSHDRREDLSTHYSALDLVDTANVQHLQVAWTYHTGDMDTVNHSQIQCRPLFVDGVLYGTTPRLKVFALCPYEVSGVVAIPKDLIRSQLRRTLGLYAPIHPVKLDVGLAGSALEL